MYSSSLASKRTLAEKQEVIADNKVALSTFRSGLAYDYVWPLQQFDGLAFTPISRVARLVVAEGRMAAESGEWNRAVNAYLDTIHIGILIPHRSNAGGAFQGLYVEANGRQYFWDAIDHLSAAETRSTLTRLETLQAKRVTADETLRDEIYAMQNRFAEMPKETLDYITTVEKGENPTSLERLGGTRDYLSVLCLRKRIVRDIQGELNQGIANTKKPISQRTWIEAKHPEYYASGWYEAMQLKPVANLTFDVLLLTRLALRAYRLEKGTYPKDLNVLVLNDYLKAMPLDRFVLDAPLRYRQDGTKYLLYSVGPDGEDDNGKIITNDTIIESQRHEVWVVSKGDIRASYSPY